MAEDNRNRVSQNGGEELRFGAVETCKGTDRTGDFIDRVLQALSP